jgi:hypothetical protein
MQPQARLSSAGGPVELAAAGSVGLSSVAAEGGAITVRADGAIYDTTGGSQVNLQTLSSLSLQAGSGIGGFGTAQLRVDADTVEAVNGDSGDVVIAGERGLKVGPAGIRSDSPEGWVALFSASGRVQPGKIESASGKMVMLSGRTGLTLREAESVLVILSQPVLGAVSGAGTALSGLTSAVGFTGATGVGLERALSAYAPRLSAQADVLGRSTADVLLFSDDPDQTAFAGGDAVPASPTGMTSDGRVGIGRNAIAAKSGSASTSQMLDRFAEGYSVGQLSSLGRSTAVMLAAALQVVERSPWISSIDTTSLGQWIGRSSWTLPEPLSEGASESAPEAVPASDSSRAAEEVEPAEGPAESSLVPAEAPGVVPALSSSGASAPAAPTQTVPTEGAAPAVPADASGRPDAPAEPASRSADEPANTGDGPADPIEEQGQDTDQPSTSWLFRGDTWWTRWWAALQGKTVKAAVVAAAAPVRSADPSAMASDGAPGAPSQPPTDGVSASVAADPGATQRSGRA